MAFGNTFHSIPGTLSSDSLFAVVLLIVITALLLVFLISCFNQCLVQTFLFSKRIYLNESLDIEINEDEFDDEVKLSE